MKYGTYYARVTDRGVTELFVEQEVEEFEYLNRMAKRHGDRRVQQIRQEALAKEEAERAYWKRNERIVTISFGLLGAIVALLGLAHIGAIAGWIAHGGIIIGAAIAVWKFKEAL